MTLIKALAAAALLTSVAASCTTTAENTQASIAEEQAASRELLADMEAQNVIIKDRGLNNYVNGVVERIAATRPAGSIPLQAYIVKDADINAFTTGGGYLFINAGLLAAMENEAQFAMVVGHEIGHIDRGHISAGKANRENAAIAGSLAQIGAAVAGVNGAVSDMAIGVGQNLTLSSFSRAQESDADETGFKYDDTAGYNMTEGARAFEVLNRVYGSGDGDMVAQFFSSHPQSDDRQAALAKMAEEAGSTDGRIGKKEHDRATRELRQEVLEFLESQGRTNEAAQIRRNLRG
ncbi:MAG: M48 family metalloprotease [Pikeienuella sp.]